MIIIRYALEGHRNQLFQRIRLVFSFPFFVNHSRNDGIGQSCSHTVGAVSLQSRGSISAKSEFQDLVLW